MRCLVDSDWVADYLNGDQDAIKLLRSLTLDGLAISLMTYGEIYGGILYSRDPARAETGFQEFLRGMTVLPLTESVMRRFAAIRGELRIRGQIIGDPDILIAATALERDLELVTRNVGHFSRINGLRVFSNR